MQKLDIKINEDSVFKKLSKNGLVSLEKENLKGKNVKDFTVLLKTLPKKKKVKLKLEMRINCLKSFQIKFQVDYIS